MTGVIYVMENPHWGRNVHKIGRSSKSSSKARMAAANGSTWNPNTTRIAFELRVTYEKTMERLIHDALRPFRITESREFFKVPLDTAIETIQTLWAEYKEDSTYDGVELVDRLDYLLMVDNVGHFALYREFPNLNRDFRLYNLKKAIDLEVPEAIQYSKRLRTLPGSDEEWGAIETKAMKWLARYFHRLVSHLGEYGKAGSGEAYFKSFFVAREARRLIDGFGYLATCGDLQRSATLGYPIAPLWAARIGGYETGGPISRRYFAAQDAVEAGWPEGYHHMAEYLIDTRIDDSQNDTIRALLIKSARDNYDESWKRLAAEYKRLGDEKRTQYCENAAKRANWSSCMRRLSNWSDDFQYSLLDGRDAVRLWMDTDAGLESKRELV